jgi:hypothetical protein
MEVFLLYHIHEFPEGEEDVKLIGVYSSRELAEQSQQRALVQPGFRETPDGFCIDCYTVNEDHWLEGYVTVTPEDIKQQWQERNAEPGEVDSHGGE